MGMTIGLNLPGSADPEAINRNLKRIADWGFDAAEVTLDNVPLIVGGEICREWLDFLKAELSSHPLAYSAHIGRDIDCRPLDGYEISRNALCNSVRVCHELGARVLVAHYEERSRDRRQEERFRSAHLEAAELGKEYGVVVCMENIEVELVDPVVDFVEQADHPNLRMNFDTGHAFLASSWFGFDFLEAFDRALPFLGHMHLNDDTGRFEPLRITDRPRYDALAMGHRFAYGRGDIHLPPFYGKIPFEALFSRLAARPEPYRGFFVCEYYSSYFLPFNASIQRNVRSSIEAAFGRG
jgi:sugar phosphate isomerase/epimerase